MRKAETKFGQEFGRTSGVREVFGGNFRRKLVVIRWIGGSDTKCNDPCIKMATHQQIHRILPHLQGHRRVHTAERKTKGKVRRGV